MSNTSKINRKFYKRLRRFERWHNITSKLAEFEGLINSYDGATPEEVKAMREIHKKLYECYLSAKNYLEEFRINDKFLR